MLLECFSVITESKLMPQCSQMIVKFLIVICSEAVISIVICLASSKQC